MKIKSLIILLLAVQVATAQVPLHQSINNGSTTTLLFTNANITGGNFYLLQVVAPILETPVITAATCNFELISYVDFNTNTEPTWRQSVYRYYAPATVTEDITCTWSTAVTGKIGTIVEVEGLGISPDNGASFIRESTTDGYEGMEDLESSWDNQRQIMLLFIGINNNPATITPAAGWTELWDTGAGTTGACVLFCRPSSYQLSAGTLPSGKYSAVIQVGISKRRNMSN